MKQRRALLMLLAGCLLFIFLSACDSQGKKIKIPTIESENMSNLYREGEQDFYRSIRYPQLKEAEKESAWLDLNDTLQQIDLSTEFPMPGEVLTWDHSIQRNDGHYLSLRWNGLRTVEDSTYPTHLVRGTTYRFGKDSALGVGLDALFTVDSAIYLPQLFDHAISLGEGAFHRVDLENQFDVQNFYLTDISLVIFYPEGVLGSHALGTPEFSIPLLSLVDILVEDLKP